MTSFTIENLESIIPSMIIPDPIPVLTVKNNTRIIIILMFSCSYKPAKFASFSITIGRDKLL